MYFWWSFYSLKHHLCFLIWGNWRKLSAETLDFENTATWEQCQNQWEERIIKPKARGTLQCMVDRESVHPRVWSQELCPSSWGRRRGGKPVLREQMIFSLPEFVKKSGKGVSISSTTLTRFNFLHKLMHKSVHKTLTDIRKDAQWCSGRLLVGSRPLSPEIITQY